jgi:ParB-like chromosome segregation protein Spo0J
MIPARSWRRRHAGAWALARGRDGFRRVHEPSSDTRPVEIAALGERLAPLRLCDATALTAVRRSLERHGQLTALTLFVESGGLEILDGFKRVRAARALGWTTLLARIDDVDAIEAKLRVAALHDRRGLTELEEAWLVRSLYREDGLGQPEIARRMSRHKSWVWRRLMLVESLEPAVQAHVRLGLLAPRAAVAVSRLPRGNQIAASTVVTRRGLTVRQTDLLVQEVLDRDSEAARADLLARRLDALVTETQPGLRPARAARNEADAMASDVARVREIAARLETRLLATPLATLMPSAAELLREALGRLSPVLRTLDGVIGTVVARQDAA